MPTDPLTGARYPAGSDAANVALYFQQAVNDLSDNAIPRFASAAARDAAYSAWVTAGGVMADGLHCTVAGVLQGYLGGAWRATVARTVYTGTGPPTFGPYTVPVGDTNPLVIGRVTTVDPGFPYRLRTYAGAEIFPTDVNGTPISSDITRVDSVMDVEGTRFDFWRGDVGNFHKHSDISPVFTGAKICNFLAYRAVPGSTGSGYWKTSTFNFYMTAEIVPA